MDIKEKLSDHNYIERIVFQLLETEENQDFIQAFQKFAPKIESEIVTAAIDKQCSCRKKVTDYVNIFKTETIDFLINYATKNGFLDLLSEIADLNNNNSISELSGRVVKLKVDEWKEFAEKIKTNVIFRSFSVVKENDDLIVFFL